MSEWVSSIECVQQALEDLGVDNWDRYRQVGKRWADRAMKQIGVVAEYNIRVQRVPLNGATGVTKPADFVSPRHVFVEDHVGNVIEAYYGGKSQAHAFDPDGCSTFYKSYKEGQVVLMEDDRSFFFATENPVNYKSIVLVYHGWIFDEDNSIRVPTACQEAVMAFIKYRYISQERSRNRKAVPLSEVSFYKDDWESLAGRGFAELKTTSIATYNEMVLENWINYLPRPYTKQFYKSAKGTSATRSLAESGSSGSGSGSGSTATPLTSLPDHTHTIGQIQGLSSELANKASVNHVHSISDITALQAALDAKANSSHNHDDSYYLKSQVDTMIAGVGGGPSGNFFAGIPEDFGAVADDVNVDCAPAFMACMDAQIGKHGINLWLSGGNYNVDQKIVLGGRGNKMFTLYGNGSIISTTVDNIDILSHNPHDTESDAALVDSEADIYVTQRLFIRDLVLSGSGTTGVTGLKIWGSYGSRVENMLLTRVDIGIYASWCLQMSYENIMGLQNAQHLLKHTSAGAESLWVGAGTAFHAGNVFLMKNIRGYNSAGCPAMILINSCSGGRLQHVICEGAAPVYGVHYIDASNNARALHITEMHDESYATGAIIYVEQSNDLHLVIDKMRCHSPGRILLDVSECNGIEVHYRDHEYWAADQRFKTNAANTNKWSFENCHAGFDPSDASRWEGGLIGNFTYSDIDRITKRRKIVNLTGHTSYGNAEIRAVYNGAPMDTWVGKEGELMQVPSDDYGRNVLLGSPFRDGFLVTQSEISSDTCVVSMWAFFGPQVNYDGNVRAVESFYTVYGGVDREIKLVANNTGLLLFVGSGFGTTFRQYRIASVGYGVLNHIALVMELNQEPRMWVNRIEATVDGQAGSNAIPKATTVSYAAGMYEYERGYYSTVHKLSVWNGITKTEAEIQTIFDGGIDYDDTADVHNANLVLSLLNDFNLNDQIQTYVDSGPSNFQVTRMNFSEPYTPRQEQLDLAVATDDHYVTGNRFLKGDFWMHIVTEPVTREDIRLRYWVPGVKAKILIRNGVSGGGGSLRINRDTTVPEMLSAAPTGLFPNGLTYFDVPIGTNEGDEDMVEVIMLHDTNFHLEHKVIKRV